MKRILVFLVVAIASASPLLAWGEKGHYLVAESATNGMPNDMPAFFYKAYSQLIYLAYEPDRLKGGGKSLDAVNEPDHYIDTISSRCSNARDGCGSTGSMRRRSDFCRGELPSYRRR